MKILNYRDAEVEGQLRWLIRGPNFDMRLVEIKPHQGLIETPHTHPWEHEVYIIDGNLAIWDGEKKQPLREGDSIYISPGEPHSFINDGSKAMHFVCCVPAGIDLNEIKSVSE